MEFSLVILTSRVGATRNQFWDGSRHFEPRSNDNKMVRLFGCGRAGSGVHAFSTLCPFKTDEVTLVVIAQYNITLQKPSAVKVVGCRPAPVMFSKWPEFRKELEDGSRKDPPDDVQTRFTSVVSSPSFTEIPRKLI
ncbi:hypothetical protein AVEN_139271-1 [Araneus ventricosus]|uniref:Uncharacterized protein n=1 Tax=Araneus ventricosus TaxID=182803 RepID=A0A4Y2MDT9_ARAVE|nr:hypothetical protein AVEN_139271-1 [Araneus ventricosus]